MLVHRRVIICAITRDEAMVVVTEPLPGRGITGYVDYLPRYFSHPVPSIFSPPTISAKRVEKHELRMFIIEHRSLCSCSYATPYGTVIGRKYNHSTESRSACHQWVRSVPSPFPRTLLSIHSHPAVPDDQNPKEFVWDSEIPGQRGRVWCEDIQVSGIFVRDNEKSGTTRSGTAGCDCTPLPISWHPICNGQKSGAVTRHIIRKPPLR